MNQRDNKRPVTEQLWAWLKGDLRSREERDLYRAAEEDPFLKEALQGYERFPEGKHTERISSIKSKLNKQKRRGVILPIRLAAAAASILIVAVSVWWITQPQASDLASAESIEQSIEEEVSTAEEPRTPVVADQIEAKEPEAMKNTAPPSVQQKETSSKPQIEKIMPAEPELAETDKSVDEEVVEEIAMDVTPPPAPPVSPAEAIKPAPPPAREETVAAGQAAAKKKSEQEEMALREYEQPKQSARSRSMQAPNAYMVPSQDIEAQAAHPVGGFPALENYLDSAWQKLWNTDTTAVNGVYIGLDFEVLKDGSLTNFVLTNSIGPEKDSTFINIMKNGPPWEYVNPLTEQPVKVRYRFPKKNN